MYNKGISGLMRGFNKDLEVDSDPKYYNPVLKYQPMDYNSNHDRNKISIIDHFGNVSSFGNLDILN